MSDYSKLTVANLRAVLKQRGIPSTGLTRKAQIIEKLEEADQAAGGASSPPDPVPGASAEQENDQPVEQADEPTGQFTQRAPCYISF